MKKLRSIILFLLITAVVMSSLYLIYNRYKHNGVIIRKPVQNSSTIPEAAETGSGNGGGTGEQTGVETGLDLIEPQKAYSFELDDINGKKIKLSDYRGKSVVVNFWATWCPYCINEMHELQKVYEKLKEDKKAVIITIAVGEEEKVVKDFVKSEGLTLPVLLDKSGDAAQNYGIQGIPATIFIDSDGNVYGHIPHAADKDTIMKTLDTYSANKN